MCYSARQYSFSRMDGSQKTGCKGTDKWAHKQEKTRFLFILANETTFLFCIVLAYPYLCPHQNRYDYEKKS